MVAFHSHQTLKTFGTGTGDGVGVGVGGPLLIISFKAVSVLTMVEASGFWLRTVPAGISVLYGISFRWEQGDFFVIPSWVCHEFRNLSTDRPAI